MGGWCFLGCIGDCACCALVWLALVSTLGVILCIFCGLKVSGFLGSRDENEVRLLGSCIDVEVLVGGLKY